jgi:glycerophosphoryl diester phosphodiesterase
MQKIGHRGAKGYEPENTLASFRKAIQLGVDAIELDVHALNDGTLVVIHDKKVNRTTNGKGYVSKKTLQELKNLNAGKGEQIPTLQEVLDCAERKVQVNIELKGKDTALPASQIIKSYVKNKGWKYSDFLVSSVNYNELRTFREFLPQVRLGLVILGIFIHPDRYVNELHAYSVHPYVKFVRRSLVEKLHKKGLKVFVYTVNSTKDIEKMKSLGVDGIFSDYPERIL